MGAEQERGRDSVAVLDHHSTDRPTDRSFATCSTYNRPTTDDPPSACWTLVSHLTNRRQSVTGLREGKKVMQESEEEETHNDRRPIAD